MNDITHPPLPRGELRVIDGPAPRPIASESDASLRESILRQYWRILVKRRWIIAAVIALSMGVGVVAAMLTQREYNATVTLEIARQAAKVVDLQDRASREQPVYDMEFYQTQYTLLKSRSLAEGVVRDLRLADNIDFLTNFTGKEADKLRALPRKARESAATGIVMANTEVIPVRLSSIVSVRYSSPQPEMAARVANSLADNFIRSNLARRFEATAYARNFLETRLEQERQKLEDAERKMVAYAGQQGLISLGNPTSTSTEDGNSKTDEGTSLATADLAGLNQAYIDARARRIQAEARYREAQRNGGRAAVTEIGQDEALSQLRQRRAILQADYQKAAADFGPEYPAQVALREQIRELDRQIGTETARVLGTVESNYRSALRIEQELEGRVNALKTNVMDQRGRSIQYNIYQRDVDTSRSLYNALLQQYKEVGVAGGVGTNNVAVVDSATVPTSPFKPSLRLNLLLALLIGSALGVAIALVIEQLAETAILPEDFQSKLGVPLLGTIPLLEKGVRPIDVLKDRKASVSEAYFSVYTGLQFVTNHGTPRSLFVTSTQPAEGKSTTALALAISLARVGKRTLLIDADMRNPSVHSAFEEKNVAGLSNVLVEDKALRDVVRETDLPTLYFMSAGHIPPNPAELLSGPAMAKVIEMALEMFDNVVIDGPPVMGLADAPLLGAVAEATVFILETGRTRATQASRALARLSAVQAPVAGAVLTKFDTKREGYGYGYGYEYTYGK